MPPLRLACMKRCSELECAHAPPRRHRSLPAWNAVQNQTANHTRLLRRHHGSCLPWDEFSGLLAKQWHVGIDLIVPNSGCEPVSIGTSPNRGLGCRVATAACLRGTLFTTRRRILSHHVTTAACLRGTLFTNQIARQESLSYPWQPGSDVRFHRFDLRR